MMELGSSQHWSKALEGLTGEKTLNVKPLLDYYGPIYKWLENYVKFNNIYVGW